MTDLSTIPNPMEAGIQPTPDTDTPQVPMANGLPPNTRGAMNMPLNPSAPQGQNQGQREPLQNTSPSQPNSAPAHAHMFNGILNSLLGTVAGGTQRPARDSRGNPVTDQNGQVVMAPASKKVLGASILAGALSGIMAGFSTPRTFDQYGHQDFSGAAKAGQQAGAAQTQTAQQQQAQGEADANTAHQYATVDHNLRLHAAILNNLKLQGDVMKQGVADDAPIIAGINEAPTISGPDGKPLSIVQASNVSEQQLQKMMADGTTHVTRDSVLRDGISNVYDQDGKQVFNPDGTPRQEYTYTVYNPQAKVALTEQMRALSPQLARVPDGTSVPLQVLASASREKSVRDNAQQTADGWIDSYNKQTGEKVPDLSLDKLVSQHPLVKIILPQIGKYSNLPVDQAFEALSKDNAVDPTALGAFVNAVGLKPDQLTKMGEARKAEEKAAQKGTDALPAPAGLVATFPADIKNSFPDLSSGQIDSLKKQLGTNPTQKDYQQAQDRAEKYSNQNTNRSLAQAKSDDTKIAKGEKPVVGIDGSGKQVLVPAGDVNKYGLAQVREVGQAENEKVTNARSLLSVFSNDDPEDRGLIQLATKLKDEGKLGPVASRLQDWLNKGGSVLTFDTGGDTDVQRLFTKLGLSTTGLMQVHVGARGSAQMLEHFEDLAKAKSMSPDAFLAALDTENRYVKMKAMLPNSGKSQPSSQMTSQTVPVGGRPILKNSQTIGYIGTDGKRVNF